MPQVETASNVENTSDRTQNSSHIAVAQNVEIVETNIGADSTETHSAQNNTRRHASALDCRMENASDSNKRRAIRKIALLEKYDHANVEHIIKGHKDRVIKEKGEAYDHMDI